ncbi:MAG: Mg2 transporter protein CorA family protein [Parcubacteria group bacterium GW2011_GWA2_43_11]|nr:MAG: Mg2 transporter protein CorA family protein [Parcubacteria group bacterium GW2011_GWC2_42_11]KKS85392.1 MAG: Mg2 transporter protein CorA family protein [Parcubacteria group bacterium GW2011_GWA2_43_11]
MLTRQTHDEITWIDLVSPTHDEIRVLMEEFSLDPLLADELLTPSLRNRVDARDDYFYVVLHFPTFKHLHMVSSTSLELDFIVGKNWIITTRYVEIDPLHQFSRIFEMETMLDRRNMGKHTGYVFYYMLSELYKMLFDELTNIGMRLDAAEDRIFEGYEKEMVLELSNISRDLLNYSQALDNHDTMLQSLETPGVALFGYEYARNIRSITGEYARLASAIKSNRESLAELRETNNSLLGTKQNEIMKIFTIMAFVTFPLSLFAAIFGMNTTVTPIIGHKWDFWIIIGIMVAGAFTFFSYFKYKKWI